MTSKCLCIVSNYNMLYILFESDENIAYFLNIIKEFI